MDTVCKSIMLLVLIQVISSWHLVWLALSFCVSMSQTVLFKNKKNNKCYKLLVCPVVQIFFLMVKFLIILVQICYL